MARGVWRSSSGRLLTVRGTAQHSISRRDSSVDLRTGAQRCEAREHHEGGVDRTNRECRRIVRIMSDEFARSGRTRALTMVRHLRRALCG